MATQNNKGNVITSQPSLRGGTTKQSASLKPKLRFNEFNEIINEIRFGKIVESNIYGPRFNANDYSEVGNVKTIRGTDLGIDGEIKYDQVPLALLDDKMVETHKLRDGDIVMITTAECGATGVFRKQNIDYLSSAYGIRIRLNDLGYPYYFKYFFQTHSAKKEINSYIRKSTIANLPGSDILRIKLNLPKLPEQQKIANFLTAVDTKLQQLTTKKETLAQYKKGVMQQLFSQQLRFKPDNTNETVIASNHENVIARTQDEAISPNETEFPDWEEKRLGDLIEICSSKRVLQKDWKEEGVPFLRTREIINLSNGVEFRTPIFISENLFDELKEKYGVPQNGDILATGVGTIGQVYIVEQTDKFYFKDGNVLWFKMNDSLNSVFLYQQFQTRFIRKQLTDNASITTVATFTIDGARKTKILYPCIKEQQKIANYLSAIDKKIEAVQTQLAQTQAFKKGLLQQMFV